MGFALRLVGVGATAPSTASVESIVVLRIMDTSEDKPTGAKPLLSVVIPTCHRNDLLALCLDRLAPNAQSLSTDFYEVVVTDDGSNSTAEAMIRDHYPWARWVPGPRKGPAANRNFGASVASNEWIVLVDDDCLPARQWLESYQKAIVPGVHVYEGMTDCEQKIRTLIEEAPLNREGGALWSCNMMIAKTAFFSVGGFDETFPYAFAEDIDFRERAKAAGFTFPFVADALVFHPPRPKRHGIASAKMRESLVLLWYKCGNVDEVGSRLTSFIFRERLVTIKRAPFSRDTPQALRSLFIEMAYVRSHLPKWEKTYRERYKGVTPAYNFSMIGVPL